MAIHRIGIQGGGLAETPTGQRTAASVAELNERAREVLRLVVEGYVETGEPVGSRALTRKLTETLSPATIRNIMADLQDAGLLYAPHTSAGRLPTDAGLRLFVNGLLEVGNLSEEERESIEARCATVGRSVTEALEQATTLLSGLSRCAGLVVTAFAHLMSFVFVERIYHAGREKLLSYRWFAWIMGQVVRVRDKVLGWVRATPAYGFAMRARDAARRWWRTMLA